MMDSIQPTAHVEKLQKLLSDGIPCARSLPPAHGDEWRTLYVVVSGVRTDVASEVDCFMRLVLPHLRHYCSSRKVLIYPVILRHGTHPLHQTDWTIYAQEIQRIRTSCEYIFLFFAAEKYGTPLPELSIPPPTKSALAMVDELSLEIFELAYLGLSADPSHGADALIAHRSPACFSALKGPAFDAFSELDPAKVPLQNAVVHFLRARFGSSANFLDGYRSEAVGGGEDGANVTALDDLREWLLDRMKRAVDKILHSRLLAPTPGCAETFHQKVRTKPPREN
jgi:hypothetical protein